MSSRRKFLSELGKTSLLLPLANIDTHIPQQEHVLPWTPPVATGQKVRIGVIGMGIMGFGDAECALKVPDVELTAVCDLYTGRLERSKEVFGDHIFTTKDHNELINRPDVDAVVICTSDNWHQLIAIDALRKKKPVYCEKPVVQNLSEGLELIKVQEQTGTILQVGSQRVSSIVLAKAKEYYKAGAIGKINCIEASFDRQSALGAWEYTMPLDISPETVDWKRYTKQHPGRPFNEKEFFWWRNYRAFGTGVAGDLFVHLVSGIHFLTDSKGPSTIFATGQLAYWKDGRDVPDVMVGILNYAETPEHPSFQVTLRVNFVSGRGDNGLTRIIGDTGFIDFVDEGLNVYKSPIAAAPGYGGWDSFTTYPKAMQNKIVAAYNVKYPEVTRRTAPREGPIAYKAPAGYDERLDHFNNFFDAIRKNKPVVEDAKFAFRAAAPCLACNESYFAKKVIHWDPINMKLIG